MSKFFVLLIFVAGLAIGFLIPRSSGHDEVGASSDLESQQKIQVLRAKFQQLSENDLNEYMKLKDLKAKYEKADEIFAKILKIFLLDLGLKVSDKQIADLESHANAAGVPENINAQPIAPTVQTEKPDPASKEIVVPANKANANAIETDEQATKMLAEKKLSNALNAWTNAKPVNREAFQAINGRFIGNIYFLEPDRTPLDLEMELNQASFSNGQIMGEFLLKTTDPSNSKYRDTTRTRPNSKVSNFRLAPDGAILVEAMGGDGIFQLYYSAQTQSFHGNLYEKADLGTFKISGSIVMNRR